ncbi:hypothetical protein [Streptomyces sp. NBC_00989]|uniref:hypothetical protein n=1 Tax=Streptomyces sp. NBC_00989 TaxID=2903705 RepID=UPI00386CDE32|nr:hypothetical protein OG714_54305 [Streptomyces sp. NBC_00989]
MMVTVSAPRGVGEAMLHLDIDDVEHERRRAAGLGVATGYGFGGLDVLMGLPHGLPVPLSALNSHQREYVRQAPAGICTVNGGQVVRHVTRPCRVTLATVRARSASQAALAAASRFTQFCARRVVITSAPSLSWPEKVLEFGLYGIGVCLEHEDGELETLAEPRPWRPKRRHTPETWWFAETAYGRFLNPQPAPETVGPLPAA